MEVAAEEKVGRTAVFCQRFKPLVPLVLGLVCARCGLIVANYGSYAKTDDGAFTDGSMLAALVVMAIVLLLLIATKRKLTDKQAHRLLVFGIFAQVVFVSCLAVVQQVFANDDVLHFLLCTFITIASSLCIFGWLRRGIGSDGATAAVFAFGALAVSEVVLYLFSLISAPFNLLVSLCLTLLQLLFLRWADKEPDPRSIEVPEKITGYFGYLATDTEDRRFLIFTAISIGFMSIVIGLLRGYPDGTPIAFTMPTRLVYGLLTIGCSLVLLASVIREKPLFMSRGTWIIMQGLACLALLVYALFPDNLEYGAVFTTMLNALMVGFTWYIIIAFETYGWRDPLYYCISGWLVWLGFRALARTALFYVYPIVPNDLVMQAFMGCLLVVSTQVVFLQFLIAADKNIHKDRLYISDNVIEDACAEESAGELFDEPYDAPYDSKLSKLMGLDLEASRFSPAADDQKTSMRKAAEQIGKDFLLTAREIEVLELYASGHTQKKVAEELHIAQSTVHAHVKRIYAKTGLHSRQQILDFINTYVS